jgi:protein phosphatase
MGTTLTMSYITWPGAYFVHIGDTRAYLYRGSELIQLTHDQTIAQMLADTGTISADQVQDHPFSHVLGSLLGCDPDQLDPSVFKTELEFGDQLLLCTDGLTRHLESDDIVEVLTSAASAELACERMVRMANEAGGRDNITVLLARFAESTRDEDGDAAALLSGELRVTT